MSLCSFVLSNCYEKYNQNQSQSSSSKKKKNHSNNVNDNNNTLSLKEKTLLIIEVSKELKALLNLAESSLGKNIFPITFSKIYTISILSISENKTTKNREDIE